MDLRPLIIATWADKYAQKTAGKPLGNNKNKPTKPAIACIQSMATLHNYVHSVCTCNVHTIHAQYGIPKV